MQVEILPTSRPSTTTPVSEITVQGDTQDDGNSFITGFGEGLVPAREAHISLSGQSTFSLISINQLIQDQYNLGTCQLPNPADLKILEDGGKVGCGGILWVAAEALTLYVLSNWEQLVEMLSIEHGITNGVKKIVEIGAGTGITGIALGLLMKAKSANDGAEIFITDIDDLVPTMKKNIELNNISDVVTAQALFWGEPLPEEMSKNVDLVLAADCVYNEKAFDILCQTLRDLSATNEVESGKETVMLFASRHRRKADMRFFKKARKIFQVVEIVGYERYEEFRVQNVHIFKMTLKKC